MIELNNETLLLIIVGVIASVFIILFVIVIWMIRKMNNKLDTGDNKEVEINELKAATSKIEEQLTKNNENVLLKQQEALTSLNGVSQNLMITYQAMIDQFQGMNVKNASDSQLINNMYSRISAMNDIMVNKKARGNWGEYQLNTLLSVYAGESQEIFEIQYPLKNGYVGDVALHLPANDKVLMIDSKFPMENFSCLLDENLSESDRKKYESLFQQNIKKHINDISKKYITQQTADCAVMFVPSEGIYTTICADFPNLIEYAHSKHVLLTSPTTLIGVVFTLVNATKDWNRSQHIKDIEKHIISMAEDSQRLIDRIDKVQNNFTTLEKSLKDVRTSSEKITTKIKKIANGAVEPVTEQ